MLASCKGKEDKDSKRRKATRLRWVLRQLGWKICAKTVKISVYTPWIKLGTAVSISEHATLRPSPLPLSNLWLFNLRSYIMLFRLDEYLNVKVICDDSPLPAVHRLKPWYHSPVCFNRATEEVKIYIQMHTCTRFVQVRPQQNQIKVFPRAWKQTCFESRRIEGGENWSNHLNETIKIFVKIFSH